MIRSAVATWTGSPAIGEGLVSTSSGVMSKALYSFGSSTGNEPCTTPSEMLAASVAACMSLILVQEMAKLHLRHERVKTEAVLTVEENKGRWTITKVDLHVTAALHEIDEEKFHRASRTAKLVCPIARALKVPVNVTTKIEPVLHKQETMTVA
jgi:lipoyl-dependent peroxiredoxin